MPALADNRIRELYRAYRDADPWPDWYAAYRREIDFFHGLSDEELGTPENQRHLWRARGVSEVGSGESATVPGAHDDPDIAAAFVALRSRTWPEHADRRANEIQAAYDRILGLVHPRHTGRARPLAKLGRAFAALLPTELYTCFNWHSYKHATELLVGDRAVKQYEGAVLARARLRALLGPEADLEETIQRSMFCWWLHEQYEALRTNEVPTQTTSNHHNSDTEPLVLWPITKQRIGLTAVSGYVETFRLVVSAATGGAEREDIVTTLQSELDSLSEKSCRRLFNRVRRMEFLTRRDGVWYPSDQGEELVESDPPDILVEKFLVQYFGLSQLLRLLMQEPRSKQGCVAALRNIYPAWTSNFIPTSIIAWAVALGLIEQRDDGLRALTDYGRIWEQRLPRDLPVPDVKLAVAGSDGDEPSAGDAAPLPAPSLADMLSAFASDPQLGEFVFSEHQLRTLHVSWHCHPHKRFAILSGLSGTGKTALLFHYARIYCQRMQLSVVEHRAIIPVSPDWRDPSGLLGYFNALHSDPTFQAEPALRLLIAAARNPHLPYFLILDEMNLARVERYFAPFLSAMETGEELLIHAQDEPVNDVPARLPWPKNLFIGGTVNMDETTHPFSDKVLDRAFTLEFFEVDLQRFLDRRAKHRGGARNTDVESLLLAVNDHLRPIRRHFGYRTAGEVLDFLDTAEAGAPLADDVRRALLDQALFSKVLPRIRGEETPLLSETIDKLIALCQRHDLARCRDKLELMNERLRTTGVTRFWS